MRDYTNKPEDYRIFNNKKNQHIKEIKKKKKKYLMKQYTGNKKRWCQLKKEEKTVESSPLSLHLMLSLSSVSYPID